MGPRLNAETMREERQRRDVGGDGGDYGDVNSDGVCRLPETAIPDRSALNRNKFQEKESTSVV